MRLTKKIILKEVRDLILYGETKTQVQRSLAVYIERGELSVPAEAFECLYRAGYEIEDVTEEEANLIYDAIGEYGVGARDNSIEELIALGRDLK